MSRTSHQPDSKRARDGKYRSRRFRELKKVFDEAYERLVDQTQQARVAWLRRPRVHTWELKDPPANIVESTERTETRARRVKELAQELNWSDERLALFKQSTATFQDESSIENYVRLRREFPEAEIEVSRFGGLEQFDALEEQFKRQGVDPKLIVNVLDADEPSVDALSLCLMECLVARAKLPNDGPGHIDRRRSAISDAIVNYLIVMMLEGLASGGMYCIPASLVMLIRNQLCGESPDLYEAYLLKERRQTVACLAAQMFQPSEEITARKVIHRMGSDICGSRSTVDRWLKDPKFRQDIEQCRKIFSGEFNRTIRAKLRAKFGRTIGAKGTDATP